MVIKVLVVDDSAFMRKMISDMLNSDPRIEVVGKVRNGKVALQKVEELDPDVVTLDVEMPVMNGIEALKRIMKVSPRRVIMLSSSTKEGAKTTIEAMENGAIDFVSKPSGEISIDIHKIKEELIEKVVQAASIPIEKLIEKKEKQIKRNKNTETPSHFQKNCVINKKLDCKGIVAIGTSTGGPKALQKILTQLPENFPHPILIVQHMPKGFTKSLSDRLNHLSKITVKEAENGEIIRKGVAYIAPGGYHLKVRKIGTSVAIQLDESELVNGHRPSVDVMFQSLAQLPNQDVMAIILTGMGSDGAKGLIELKKKHCIAIAESEETSIVFGMPRSAIATNEVDIVANIEDIADVIIRHCQ